MAARAVLWSEKDSALWLLACAEIIGVLISTSRVCCTNMAATSKEMLIHLGERNRLLADELAKLPEMRRAPSASTGLALENLVAIYSFDPGRFDRLFDVLYPVGLPAYRKYCSPLQAVFWIIQDTHLADAGALMGLDITKTTDEQGLCRPQLAANGFRDREWNPPASLKQTLDAAWHDETELIRPAAIREIIHRLQPPAEGEEYALLAKRHSDRQLQNYILDDYLKRREIFNTRDWAVIDKALHSSRWKMFFAVADRLNAPELIDHYINENFFFHKTPANGVYFTFYEKKAQCTDAAYFTRFMLDRGGYRTFMRSVKWDEDPWDGLHTGAGIVCDDGSYLLVANYTGINAITGPFSTVGDLDHQLSCGRKIIASKWGAYYPPRHY
jgi:hypothetical protein